RADHEPDAALDEVLDLRLSPNGPVAPPSPTRPLEGAQLARPRPPDPLRLLHLSSCGLFSTGEGRGGSNFAPAACWEVLRLTRNGSAARGDRQPHGGRGQSARRAAADQGRA